MKHLVVLLMIAGAVLHSQISMAQTQTRESKLQKEKQNVIELRLSVEGMHCQAGCADGIDNMLAEQAGIVKSKTLYDSSSSVVRFNPKLITEQEIVDLIKEWGFSVKKTSKPNE